MLKNTIAYMSIVQSHVPDWCLCREKIKCIYEILYGLNCAMWHRVIHPLFGTIVISSPEL